MPETDALHDGAGVFTSAAGDLVRKYSDYPAGKYKAVCVWHAFKNVNQANVDEYGGEILEKAQKALFGK